MQSETTEDKPKVEPTEGALKSNLYGRVFCMGKNAIEPKLKDEREVGKMFVTLQKGLLFFTYKEND